MPTTVAAAWAEYEAAEKLSHDRYTVDTYCDPEVFVNARQYVVEELCNTLPARSLSDLRARLSWIEFWVDSEIHQEPKDHRVNLTTLRADIERLGARIREQDVDAVQDGQAPTQPNESFTGKSQNRGVGQGGVQDGRRQRYPSAYPSRRTNAEKRRDVLALFGDDLSDREIARRAGVSPQTVGNIRRARP